MLNTLQVYILENGVIMCIPAPSISRAESCLCLVLGNVLMVLAVAQSNTLGLF